MIQGMARSGALALALAGPAAAQGRDTEPRERPIAPVEAAPADPCLAEHAGDAKACSRHEDAARQAACLAEVKAQCEGATRMKVQNAIPTMGGRATLNEKKGPSLNCKAGDADCPGGN